MRAVRAILRRSMGVLYSGNGLPHEHMSRMLRECPLVFPQTLCGFRSDRRLSSGVSRVALRPFLGMLILLVGSTAQAQTGLERAVVTVDDSPVAQQFFREAMAQSVGNPDRAAGLARKLLEDYSGRLLAEDPNQPDAFLPVRTLVIDLLKSNPALLQAWLKEVSVSASEMLEVVPPQRTFDIRPMTPAGFQAGLRLAQVHAENGTFTSALQILDELDTWPGAAQHVRGVNSLRAISAGLAALEVTGVDRSELMKLENVAISRVQLEDAALADRIREMVDTLDAIEGLESIGSTSRSPARIEMFDKEDWAQIWEEELPDTLYRRRFFDSDGGQVISRSRAQRARAQASNMTSVPVMVEDVVLVNEGLLLRAWDRLTGRVKWARPFGLAPGVRPAGTVGDMGEIVARGEAAVTVVGHAYGGGRNGSGEVIRFDPDTSVERWRVRPSRLLESDDLKDAFISGPPMILGDQVIVPLRKVNSRLETVDFVAGLELDSGEARWVQPIASSGGVRMGASRPFNRLAEMDGDVVICSSVGAVARLDGATGRPRWLRRFEVPLRPQQYGALPWEIGGAAILRNGIACISPGLDEWLLLDPETGEVMSRHPIGAGTPLDQPRYLHAVQVSETGGEMLIGIGQDIVAIDPSDPTNRLWTFSEGNGELIEQRPERGDRHGIRGRVQLLQDGLAVPFGDSVALVGLQDGRIRLLLSVEGGGNPLILDDQIFLANDDRLHAYMPLGRAVEALRDRLLLEPTNLDQALALLDLARRAGNIELAMEASELAVASLDVSATSDLRGEVLDRLLLVLRDDLLPEVEAERIHVFAERIARTPEEHVKRLLAEGDWSFANEKTRDAVEAWRTILLQSEYSSVPILERGTVQLPASTAAEMRIRMVRNRDPSIAERLDRETRESVASAIERRATAEELLGIIRSGADSPALIRAGERAVEILRDEGRLLEAIGTARALYDVFEIEESRRLLNIAAEAAITDGRPALAMQLLREAGESQAAISKAGLAAAWPELDGSPDTLPNISTDMAPSSVDRFDGRMVSLTQESMRDAPENQILVVDNGQLKSLGGPSFTEKWSLPVEDQRVKVIRHEPFTLIWEFSEGHDPKLTAIDPTSGARLWEAHDIQELLPAAKDSVVTPEGTRPDRTPFLPWKIHPVPTDRGLALIRSNGAAAMLDTRDGNTVLWSRKGLPDRIYGTLWDGGLLHIWGVRTKGSSSIDTVIEPVLVSIDPATGSTIHEEILQGGEPQWAVAVDGGRVAIATPRNITMVAPMAPGESPRRQWRHSGPEVRDTNIGWASGGQLVAADKNGVLVALNTSDAGIATDRWKSTFETDWTPTQLVDVIDLGDAWLLQYRDRLLAFDQYGNLIGSDSISDSDRADWRVLPTRESILLLSRRMGTGKYLFRVHRLDLESGLRIQGAAFDVQPPGRSYESARVINGWLLLGSSSSSSTSGAQIDAIPLRSGD